MSDERLRALERAWDERGELHVGVALAHELLRQDRLTLEWVAELGPAARPALSRITPTQRGRIVEALLPPELTRAGPPHRADRPLVPLEIGDGHSDASLAVTMIGEAADSVMGPVLEALTGGPWNFRITLRSREVLTASIQNVHYEHPSQHAPQYRVPVALLVTRIFDDGDEEPELIRIPIENVLVIHYI